MAATTTEVNGMKIFLKVLCVGLFALSGQAQDLMSAREAKLQGYADRGDIIAQERLAKDYGVPTPDMYSAHDARQQGRNMQAGQVLSTEGYEQQGPNIYYGDAGQLLPPQFPMIASTTYYMPPVRIVRGADFWNVAKDPTPSPTATPYPSPTPQATQTPILQPRSLPVTKPVHKVRLVALPTPAPELTLTDEDIQLAHDRYKIRAVFLAVFASAITGFVCFKIGVHKPLKRRRFQDHDDVDL
jgi:hypothetical protein